VAASAAGAAGLLTEPAWAAQGFRAVLDRQTYAPGDTARLTVVENVPYPRRFRVRGPGSVRWAKIDGGMDFSIFAAPVSIAGVVTVDLVDRTTKSVMDRLQLTLNVRQATGGGDTFVAYTPDSYFRRPIDGAPIDAAATKTFRAFMKSHPDQRDTAFPLIRGTDANMWGMPFALGQTGDPIWRLAGSVPSKVSSLVTDGFAAPAWLGEALTGTSDSPLVVIDRAAGRTIWAANAKLVASGVISVGAAGCFEHDSNGLDYRNPRSNSTANFRSRGVIPDAMVIRKDLVDAAVATDGDLGHVLHMFFVETDSSSGFCHPMVGNESGKFGFGAEGIRIAIAPDVDVSDRGLSPEGEVLARTLQRHGCYLGDNSGSASGIKAEQESSGRRLWNGRLPADVLNGIRWDDFVVLPEGWQ
jgi:hypothetical protein